MIAGGNPICLLLSVFQILVFGRIVLSWFPVTEGSALSTVFGLLYRVTEPVLGPIRRVLPPIGMGGMGLDLSPFVILLVISVLC